MPGMSAAGTTSAGPVSGREGKRSQRFRSIWIARGVAMASKIEKKREHIEPESDPAEAYPVRAAVADRWADHCSSIAELASGIAHEINNPLNGIINYAQILLNRLADRKSEAEIAARIIFEGERISGVIRSLMTFTAQDDDIKSLYTLEELLSVCLDLSHAQLKEDGIRLMLDIKDGLPPMLVDASRMRLIFLNIISNARHALNKRYPLSHYNKTLDISGRKKESHRGTFVRVEFLDHGGGVSSLIPSPERGASDPGVTGGDGAGLSPAQGSSVILQHGGTIQVDRVPGEYTRIVIELPAARLSRETFSVKGGLQTP